MCFAPMLVIGQDLLDKSAKTIQELRAEISDAIQDREQNLCAISNSISNVSLSRLSLIVNC